MNELLTYEIFESIINDEKTVYVEQAKKFKEMMMMYGCAIKEVRTRIEVLNEEFQVRSQRNPIESIKSRIKKPKSILEKCIRKGYELSFDSIQKNVQDIAGIRVICPFIDDIYAFAEMLTNQDDLQILEIEDYIQNPKTNGYRSLHLIILVPIFLSDKKIYMKVEVQIRTIAMDFWASLEHEIHYKKFHDDEAHADIIAELKECADVIYSTDTKMEKIRRKLEATNAII